MDHMDDDFNNLLFLESWLEEQKNTTADTGGAAVTTTSASSLSSSPFQSWHDSPGSGSGFASFYDKAAGSSSSQSPCIPAYDDLFTNPATADHNAGYEKLPDYATWTWDDTPASSAKRPLEKNESESKADQKTKKSRSSSETLDHTTSERKRRQEFNQKVIAIAAKLPDLKKFDKLSVLSEAINRMEKLEGRVEELEEQKKISDDRESLLMSKINELQCHQLNAKDNDHHHHHQNTISSCTSDDKCFRIINQGLPEIEARVLDNQILIRIHCEKPDSVMPTILAQLKSLHLSIISSSNLNFANSTLDITILARVDEHEIEVKEVVEKLRSVLLETSQPIKLISAVQP